MLVRCMRAIAIYAKSVEHRHVKSSSKVAVGCSAHCPFSEFKAESRGDIPRVMKQLYDAGRAFERRTIDAAFDCKANTPVKRLEGIHQMLDATRFLHCAEAYVYFHLRLRRDDIAVRSATKQTDIKARTGRRIVQRV
jgi:hypothetical protein